MMNYSSSNKKQLARNLIKEGPNVEEKIGANQVAVTQVGNVWNLIKDRVPAGVNIGETGRGEC